MGNTQTTTVSSTPSFLDFNPEVISYQYRVIYDIKTRFKYDIGPHFCLLSGSIGSAKSCLMAFLIISHCVENRGACALIGRLSMPDLKDTIWQKVIEMLDGSFIEGVDYVINNTTTSIKFLKTGSEIITRSWHDKKFKKFRSLELSFIAIEELTENDSKYWAFFTELIGRLGRRPHIKENVFIAATNPDDPSHNAYKFFIKGSIKKGYYAVKGTNIHTYYSLTEQNPFLPKWYVKSLEEKYDEKMCRRLLRGEWLYIAQDVIYYKYNPVKHFVLKDSVVDLSLPVRLSFDFNIQKGKPMSSCLFQFNRRASGNPDNPKDSKFIFIDEVAIEGADTGEAIEEWANKGYFDLPSHPEIIIHGDASGRHSDTRSKTTDYEIIEDYLDEYTRNDGQRVNYSMQVPRSNPAIRSRHNFTNGVFENKLKLINVAVDQRCTMIDKGFSNTRLKDGAGYIEDQTTEGQDISTACSYGIYYCLNNDYEEEEIEFS